MKKIILSLALAVLSSIGFCDTTTNRLGLTLPTIGSPTWGQKINGNFQILDATVAALGQTNTYSSTVTFNGYVQINSTVNWRNLQLGTGQCIGVNSSSNTILIACGSGGTGSGIVSPGTFTWTNFQGISISTFAVRSGGAGSFYSSDNSDRGFIQNQGATASQMVLNSGASNGVGINATAPAGVVVFINPGGVGTYGNFAVKGSSADASSAYSGFSATSPITQSTLWTLPTRDGTNGQALITDGSAHTSWSTVGGSGGGAGYAVEPATVTFNLAKGVTVSTITATSTTTLQFTTIKGAVPVLSTSTLQSGATIYVSSATIGGPLRVANSFGSLNIIGGTGISSPGMFADGSGILGLGGVASSPAVAVFGIPFTNESGINLPGGGFRASSSSTSISANLQISSAVYLANSVGTSGQFFSSGGPGAVPTWSGLPSNVAYTDVANNFTQPQTITGAGTSTTLILDDSGGQMSRFIAFRTGGSQIGIFGIDGSTNQWRWRLGTSTDLMLLNSTGQLFLSSLSNSLPVQTNGSGQLTSAAIDLSGAQATGTMAAARLPALTGDVTTSAGSAATTATAIQGNIRTFTSSITITGAGGLQIGTPTKVKQTGNTNRYRISSQGVIYTETNDLDSTRSAGFDAVTASSQSFSFVNFWQSSGTMASPLAVQAGQTMGRVATGGYGATAFGPSTSGRIDFQADGTFTDTSMPTSINFYTTPSASITPVLRMIIAANGATTVISSLTVTGILLSTAVYVSSATIGTDEYANGAYSSISTITWQNGNFQKVTMTANTTFNFLAPAHPATLTLHIFTGSGGFTAAWPASVKWSGAAAPTITATASKSDFVVCKYGADANYYCSAAGTQNF